MNACLALSSPKSQTDFFVMRVYLDKLLGFIKYEASSIKMATVTQGDREWRGITECCSVSVHDRLLLRVEAIVSNQIFFF